MKNNMKKILLLTGVLCLASVGGVSAYLTDFDHVSNQFTVGKVDVKLTEDNWKPDDNKKIEPGKVISKDPKIKNIGINDTFAYLEVSIPMANVTAAADNGSRLEQREQELFLFESKNSWTKLSARKVGSKQVYVFAYNRVKELGVLYGNRTYRTCDCCHCLSGGDIRQSQSQNKG